MKTPNETQADVVRRLLALEIGTATTDVERMDAVAVLFEKTFGALAPVIGADGVDAIFKRSVRLTKRDFPCLALVSSQDRRVDPRQFLSDCQKGSDAEHFYEVAVALYARFFASMATLIGERLASQIIQTAWPRMAESSTRTKENEG